MKLDEFTFQWMGLLPGLRSYCLQLTSYEKQDAEDLIQDTYIKAQLALNSYNEEFSLKTWIYSIAKNKFSDDYRRKRRRSAINVPMSHAEIGLDMRSDISDVDRTNSKNILKENSNGLNLNLGNFIIEDILKAIDKLEEKERVLFRLLIEGYQYDEISEKTKQPIGTVKARIYAARRKLWFLLEDYNEIKGKFKR